MSASRMATTVIAQRAKESGLLPSMGTVGACYDTQSIMMVVGAGRAA
jgi:hypothetical protein